MLRLIPVHTLLLATTAAALLALTSCMSPPSGPLIGGAPSGSSAARGGDAEGDALATRVALAYAAPGADARVVPVENSDQVTSTQSAPAYSLALVSDVGAAIAGDPLVRSLALSLADSQARLAAAETPEDVATAREHLAADREALAARVDLLRESLLPGAAATVEHLYYMPVTVMSNGETTQRLDAATAHAASRALLAAVLAGLDEETAALVARALTATPP
jgi:hypothetical protein